ncbi:MAG: hypothetical protein EOT04_03000 [Candidatus Chaera renei]|uniref:Ribulose-phosphate 3-epimerase n=1 Tax=Candidatus Chaera renei TaxID=2506947 RepID=A0A4Q0AGJ8_9BACT|nr:MAG: hypothetical protein EOT04_03000 [Candidatus Chaera renei]
MSLICPAVLAADPQDYRRKINIVTAFAKRIHIDLSDGDFAPGRSINPIQAWWPPGVLADIHLMYRHPLEHIETMVSLGPNLAIIHAEAEGDLAGMMEHLKRCGQKIGLAMLADTEPDRVSQLIGLADHVLIFSGKLGSYGGSADLSLLQKIGAVKRINSQAEIGWDGGADPSNVQTIAAAGVEVIVAGGSIMQAGDPAAEYAKLANSIS